MSRGARPSSERPRSTIVTSSVIEKQSCTSVSESSITELVTMEDLGLSEEGRAPRDILDGRYDREGAQPCQIDGGLKCFGHPVGASGLRMAYEVYTQLLGRAGGRQLDKVDLGLTHNLGGAPFNSVAAVSIFGRMN